MTRGLPLRVRQLLRDISYQIIIRNHIFFVFGHFFRAIGKKTAGIGMKPMPAAGQTALILPQEQAT